MGPLISVLLTSFNREEYLAQSIESVLAQTLADLELIISDNCSTDRSVEIAREYARRDSRIQMSTNERNIGQFENRRKVAALARGRYLKYHDSDDVMYPHCLAVMASALEDEPCAGFALSGSRAWPGGPCPMLLTPQLAYEREFLGLGLFHLGPAGAMFRTQVFRDLGGFPVAGVASDYIFWLKACATVNVLLVPGDLFYYRIHPGQELANPENEIAYARAAAEAWRMLHSAQCPLTGDALELGKRNFVFARASEMYRHLKSGRFRAAAAVFRHCGLGPGDWVSYLRPSQRSPSAGTPPVSEEPLR